MAGGRLGSGGNGMDEDQDQDEDLADGEQEAEAQPGRAGSGVRFCPWPWGCAGHPGGIGIPGTAPELPPPTPGPHG